jgi:G:T-mismatch repair DNA endonuclease (very short patch repair protein)
VLYSLAVAIAIVSSMQTSREISYRVRDGIFFCFCFGHRKKCCLFPFPNMATSLDEYYLRKIKRENYF